MLGKASVIRMTDQPQGSSKVGRVVWFRCHAVSIARGEQRTQCYAISSWNFCPAAWTLKAGKGWGKKKMEETERSQIKFIQIPKSYIMLHVVVQNFSDLTHLRTCKKVIRVESTFFWRQGLWPREEFMEGRPCPTIPNPQGLAWNWTSTANPRSLGLGTWLNLPLIQIKFSV